MKENSDMAAVSFSSNEEHSKAQFFLKAVLAAVSGASLPAMIFYLLM